MTMGSDCEMISAGLWLVCEAQLVDKGWLAGRMGWDAWFGVLL